MPRGGKTGGKLASSRSSSTVYQRSSSAASSTRSQEIPGSVASVLAELQSLLVHTQVGGLYLELRLCSSTVVFLLQEERDGGDQTLANISKTQEKMKNEQRGTF